ncbi:hypothetical protein BTZ20_1695 [Rhodococcus sp. MTM3W5.2]|nr:hypothetical protein BTZ20_1695 [Rhodococcus sp. MTM3W5.2]
MVACLGQVEDGEGLGGLTRGQQERRDTPSSAAIRCSTASWVGFMIRV